ncbi:MAG: putative regulatory protein [Frankiales bacterium]|nr:putative regulatory protein [Frankiales bacterium]
MPTYEYACTACGERLEAVQSFTDPALSECPACGGALRKVFSPVGVVFKGSGFYKTDSRSSSSGASSGSTGDAKSDSKSSADAPAKSDSAASTSSTSSTSSSSSSTSSTPAAKTA